MKLVLTFKTPDATDNALEVVPDSERDKAARVLAKFIRWGEILRVQIDTDKETAEVLPW